MAQLSKEQEKQMAIMTSTTSTREEKLAATKLYTDMIKMESVAVDPENFMGEMDVPEETEEPKIRTIEEISAAAKKASLNETEVIVKDIVAKSNLPEDQKESLFAWPSAIGVADNPPFARCFIVL